MAQEKSQNKQPQCWTKDAFIQQCALAEPFQYLLETKVLEGLQQTLNEIFVEIKSADDFESIYQTATKLHLTFKLQISSIEKFKDIFSKLKPEFKKPFFNIVFDQLVDFTNSVVDVKQIFSITPYEFQDRYLTSVQEKLEKDITTIEKLRENINFLSQDVFLKIKYLGVVKSVLKQLTNSVDDFSAICQIVRKTPKSSIINV